MTGIDAVLMNFELSKQVHYSITANNFYISAIIVYLSSILRSVMARSMSLDSSASPVYRDPKRMT
jgi:hypothetical protein